MPVTPYSAGASRRVHPAPTTPAAKPRRLLSATQTPPSQKTPQRLLMASSPYNTSPYNTPVRYTPPGASTCACWHGKQPPPWRVAWAPSPYLEDLTKTLVIAPPVRRIPLTLTVTLNLHPQPSPSIPTTHRSPLTAHLSPFTLTPTLTLTPTRCGAGCSLCLQCASRAPRSRRMSRPEMRPPVRAVTSGRSCRCRPSVTPRPPPQPTLTAPSALPPPSTPRPATLPLRTPTHPTPIPTFTPFPDRAGGASRSHPMGERGARTRLGAWDGHLHVQRAAL